MRSGWVIAYYNGKRRIVDTVRVFINKGENVAWILYARDLAVNIIKFSLPSHRNWKEKVGSFQRTCHTAGK
jgi:hypothetical protein